MPTLLTLELFPQSDEWMFVYVKYDIITITGKYTLSYTFHHRFGGLDLASIELGFSIIKKYVVSGYTSSHAEFSAWHQLTHMKKSPSSGKTHNYGSTKKKCL
eukprot:snap_masked-scaffold_2-processed-gene-5.36-mRNA-1 protein AED:1.00 eAED:1.00 QI:0/0/0/0/1/1/3/0/101